MNLRPTTRLLLTRPAPLQVCLDEGMEVTIKDPLNVSDFEIGTKILDHLVRLQDIGADLPSPGSFVLISTV